MSHRCPNPACTHPKPRKNGFFYRTSDAKSIQKWKCFACRRCFSSATFERAFRQHKRRVNPLVRSHLSSGVSQRRAALILHVHRTTIARKLVFLAGEALNTQETGLKAIPKVCQVQFDDLITLEHTKCKPLAVTVAVEAETRRILGFEVSSIPASGPLAKFSRERYGPRPNERPQAVQRLLSKLKSVLDSRVEFSSDRDPLYVRMVKACFPGAMHHRYKGARGSDTGQGELKKLGHDPLFWINHTLAMLRANINRLFRRTWCTTKKKEGLERHLAVYMGFHNTVLIPPKYRLPG